jgi:hypothetical protein
MKICSSKGYRIVEDMIFFGFLSGSPYENSKQTKRHTSIPHRKPKIWYHLIVWWVSIFRDIWVSRLVEISMLIIKAPDSVGSKPCSHYTMAPLVSNPCTHELASPRSYVPVSKLRTQARTGKTISNCRWMISSQKLGSYKPNVGKTILDRLI